MSGAKRRCKTVVRSDGAVFPSTYSAAESVMGDQTNISAACRGKRKSAYGYKWRYESEAE